MTPKQRLIAAVGAGVVALAVPVVTYFEGTVLRTYRDPIGILTACVGHTGPELSMGQKFTPAQCEDMLYRDLLKHADDLNCITVPLTQPQKAALLSFTFNVGRKQMCGSTLARKANSGHPASDWCLEMLRWTLAGGQRLPGLVKRREAESALCLTPEST